MADSEHEGDDGRLARLEARAALSELVTYYCNAVDDRDFDTLLSLFADGAGFRHVAAPAGSATTGKEAIRRFFERRFETAPGPTLHVVHSQIVKFVDPEHARGLVTGRTETAAAGTCEISALRYFDTYVVEDGKWKIAERAWGYVYRVGVDAMGAAFGSEQGPYLTTGAAPSDMAVMLRSVRRWV